MSDTISRASVRPLQTLDLLSRQEMVSLAHADAEIHALFRRCALAVLTTGAGGDDARSLFERFHDFDIEVVSEPRGLKLELSNAPAQAFVDGRMVESIRHHLFSALRDIIFTHHKLAEQQVFNLATSAGITDAVFRILRNADVVRSNTEPKLVVCWGGHAIGREEYEFCKEVGYELGLRGFDICTGCGPGAMKGPMKGAAIAHAKQRNTEGRFIGLTEPGIIAAESPNPIVNELAIMPDIEKRLEAFVRLAHTVIVFPGGAGTLEEIMFLLGVKLHPANHSNPLPMVLAAPAGSERYFEQIDRFLRHALGEAVRQHYEIVIGDSAAVARGVKRQIKTLRRSRVEAGESFSFAWELAVPEDLQRPFQPTHEAMAALRLDRTLPAHELVAELRRAFSGIVAGNVKESGQRAVDVNGPFLLTGDPELVRELGILLEGFVKDGRMKLDPSQYRPCFRLAS